MLYYDIAKKFKSYLESLDFEEIQALNLDIKANGGGLLPIEQYSDSVELLKAFNLFYYINGRLPFTTGLLTIPDSNVPNFVKIQKISIKNLYEHFRGTASHGLVSVPFLSALDLFFVRNNETPKNALSKLYYNLTLQVLSEEHIDHVSLFDSISNLTAEINLEIQKTIRSRKLKREKDEQNFKNIRDTLYKFKEEKTDFEKTENEICSKYYKK